MVRKCIYARRIEHLVLLVAAATLALSLASCSPKEEVGRYEAPIEEELAPGLQSGAMKPDAVPASAGETLTYEKPESWTAGEVRGIRKAAFAVEDGEQKAEITVIDLPASAGMLLPNVNIWRQQIQLGESTAEELREHTGPIELGEVKGHYVELVGPADAAQREAILAVMAVRGPKAWFFKLKGDAELVLAEKELFQDFVKSVKFQAAKSNRSTPPQFGAKPESMPGGGGGSPLAYDVPEGWAPGPVRGIRKAAFRVADGDQKVEITAIDLAASGGDLLLNVNRWREQIQLGKITAEELQKTVQPIQFAGGDGHYVELLGAEDAERRLAILGAIALRDRKAWFIKLTGDAELALREKERFQQFLKSVRFTADQPPTTVVPAKETPAKETPSKEVPAKEAPTKEAPAEGADQDE